MAIGILLDKAHLDTQVGTLTRDLNVLFTRVGLLHQYLSGQSTENLVDLGYTEYEAAVLKGAFTDLDTLRQVYLGLAAVAQAKDFTAYAKLLWGTGY